MGAENPVAKTKSSSTSTNRLDSAAINHLDNQRRAHNDPNDSGMQAASRQIMSSPQPPIKRGQRGGARPFHSSADAPAYVDSDQLPTTRARNRSATRARAHTHIHIMAPRAPPENRIPLAPPPRALYPSE